ncbi:MAG: hypothetical protein COV46_00910 [Deltaproteobacteria bacterium CG11_big_fil_rev_8_21_14_0_20_49_13]|nr:MAG: hypothetical protein COV46_00910 [Deltaproteobacteria bacterium CG11_big_fil_rev_8_21_14_0_20_49_13]
MLQYEIYSEVTKNLNIEIKNDAVEALDTSVEKGKAVRVIKDGRLGFAFSTSPDTKDEDLIEMAVGASQSVQVEPELVFPEVTTSTFIGENSAGLFSATLDEKIGMTRELESAALAFDKRIKNVRQPCYEEMLKEVHIVNSNGVDVSFASALCAFRVTSIAEDEKGSERASEMEYAFDPKKLSPSVIGKKASERAVSYLNSKKIASTMSPVILDRQVVAEILSLIAPSFFADAVHKNRSRFRGKLNTRIYSPNISVINDPTRPNGFASVPYDAEGSASKRTPVVRGGILQNFLSDAFYAKKVGLPSTASSIRPLISQTPKIGIRNFYIEKGNKPLNQLKREMKVGFYVTDVMGLHMVNQITGDFSVGAEGFWVEDGQDLHGVKGVTIAGNLHDMLNHVTGVGNDLKFWHLTGGVSLLVEGLSVSGT